MVIRMPTPCFPTFDHKFLKFYYLWQQGTMPLVKASLSKKHHFMKVVILKGRLLQGSMNGRLLTLGTAEGLRVRWLLTFRLEAKFDPNKQILA